MTAPVPYLYFSGTAREALTFYAGVFGGEVHLLTQEQMGARDGRADAIAHGQLAGPGTLFASDVGSTLPRVEGLHLALLGSAPPDTLRGWYAALAEGGRILDDLQERPWGDWDGTVVDRYGMTWLIGFHPES